MRVTSTGYSDKQRTRFWGAGGVAWGGEQADEKVLRKRQITKKKHITKRFITRMRS